MIPIDYQDKLSKMQWSFSRVSSFDNCKKCWKMSYLDKLPQEQNAFSEWGSFGHQILEDYFKGKIELFEMGQIYEDEYDENVTKTFPPNKYVDLATKYFEDGRKYFTSFKGLDDRYEVAEVEGKISINIEGFPFIGYVDLVLKDKTDGRYIVVDHKSKSKMNKVELWEKVKQLYLYAFYIKEQYGEYPKELVFNMFRSGTIARVAFDKNDLEKVVEWFTATIKKILNEKDFLDKIEESGKTDYNYDDFFCSYLCGVRKYCDKSPDYKGYDTEEQDWL